VGFYVKGFNLLKFLIRRSWRGEGDQGSNGGGVLKGGKG